MLGESNPKPDDAVEHIVLLGHVDNGHVLRNNGSQYLCEELSVQLYQLDAALFISL